MTADGSVILVAPLSGWSTALEEVPDEAFAAGMLGDGLALDPTGDTLYAPCDGEVSLIAQAHHAITLRAPGGAQILMHVGLDTVALAGEGFALRVAPGARVRQGEALLSFDLDFLARQARSLMTPVILVADSACRIVRRSLDRELQAGDFLMELAPARTPSALDAPAPGEKLHRRLTVTLQHGLHARPAAGLSAALKGLAAEVRVLAHGREANARSTVGLMALGVGCGDLIEVSASGPQAAAALEALTAALAAAAAREAATAAAPKLRPPAAAAPARKSPPSVLDGVIGSRGVGLGPAVHLSRPRLAVAECGGGASEESAALERARATVRTRLAGGGGAGAVPTAAHDILGAHLELLDDPEILGAAGALIDAGKSAAFAWRAAIRTQVERLSSLADARLRERADDLLDLEAQVLLSLAGLASAPAPQIAPGAIVLARELLPSQLLALESSRIAGIALAEGGATSHVSILAAAMGVPALAALGTGVLSIGAGTMLVLDAERGRLEIDPPRERVLQVRKGLAARDERAQAMQRAAQDACRTADGTRIEVLANVASVAEAQLAVRNGAEGCGLLRTEFLFLDRATAPHEAEQTAAYQAIADALGARPLTIRTLDVGGDKPIAYLPLPREDNPALGLRGIRTSLAYPQLLREQLRAVLAIRAAVPVRLLLPMVTDAADVLAVRAVLEELQRASGRAADLRVGAMIETPASAILAARVARVADFLSIGTNDLTQYTLAMDRGHPQLAPRLDALHPAVLRLIADVAQAAAARGRHAAVCGGLASEPLAAALLVGLGVRELSAVPAVIPQLKTQLAGVRLEACRALAVRALELESAAQVRALLGRAGGDSP